MATIEQIKSLIRAYYDNSEEKFKAVALQIAAHEANIGHVESAREIKAIVQNTARSRVVKFQSKYEMIEQQVPKVSIADMVLSDALRDKINRIILEYKKKNILQKNGLKNRSKILITGAPGTGKTMTAGALANELSLPFFLIQFDRLITKYMGETSVKLRQVFDAIAEIPGVYLFDEFDAIGSDRKMENDVGEMRRILNSFLQYLDADDSRSIIIATTNNPNLLDKALFRRFDDVIEYTLPDESEILELMRKQLSGVTSSDAICNDVLEAAIGLSQADITKACNEAVKASVISNTLIDKTMMLSFINERRGIYDVQEA